MKKIVMFGLVAMMLQTSALAKCSFWSLSYAPKAEGKKLGGYKYDDSDYIKLKLGNIGEKSMELGYYLDLGVTINSGSNGSSDIKYNYYILNFGPTLNVSKNVTLYGGVGAAYQRGEYFNNYVDMTSKDTKTEMNVNAGAMFTYSRYGLSLGYDSAPKAVNFGLVYKY